MPARPPSRRVDGDTVTRSASTACCSTRGVAAGPIQVRPLPVLPCLRSSYGSRRAGMALGLVGSAVCPAGLQLFTWSTVGNRLIVGAIRLEMVNVAPWLRRRGVDHRHHTLAFRPAKEGVDGGPVRQDHKPRVGVPTDTVPLQCPMYRAAKNGGVCCTRRRYPICGWCAGDATPRKGGRSDTCPEANPTRRGSDVHASTVRRGEARGISFRHVRRSATL